MSKVIEDVKEAVSTAFGAIECTYTQTRSRSIQNFVSEACGFSFQLQVVSGYLRIKFNSMDDINQRDLSTLIESLLEICNEHEIGLQVGEVAEEHEDRWSELHFEPVPNNPRVWDYVGPC